MAKKALSPQRRTLKPQPISKQLSEGLAQVDQLMETGQLLEARVRLEDLVRRFPENPEVLSRFLSCTFEIKDGEGYQEACERLLAIHKDDPELTLALAGAYLMNSRPILARKAFLDFLERWPKHETSLEVRASLGDIDQYLIDQAETMEVPVEDTVRMLEMHERMQSLLHQGRNRQAISIGEEIIRQFANYLPAYNNVSQIYWVVGQRSKAIELTQEVLERDPDNVHALANLVKYYLLSGEIEEAHETSQRLKSAQESGPIQVFKILEALSYLADDQAVLEAFHRALERGEFAEPGSGHAMTYHLAAVASLRLGNEQQAKDYWQKSLELSPIFLPARLNLEDLGKPAQERHAPWAFRIAQWLPEKEVQELMHRLDSPSRRKDDQALQQATRTFLKSHAYIPRLAPAMLELGDEASRNFLLVLARFSDSSELLEAVKDFTLGQRGPDQYRLESAQILSQKGFLPTGMTRMWVAGNWIDILLIGIRIHGKAKQKHSQEVEKLATAGLDSIQKGDGKSAEEHLRQGIAIEPEAPDLSYHLAAAYQLQGRHEEARKQLVQVVERFPDYIYGKASLAQMLVESGELEQAREMLAPLFLVREMYYSEFDAFCAANIELSLAEKNQAVARAWFGMWESANPKNPYLENYRWRLAASPRSTGDVKDWQKKSK